MSLTRDQVVAYLERLSTTELAALIDALQQRLGVRPQPPPPPPPVFMGAPPPGPHEQTEFTVVLTSFGADKLAVIKAVRELLPALGLMEAKKLVESAPTSVREYVHPDEARQLAERLRQAGAQVEIR